ncbi:MAG: Gfo/Idh/MocA family oxidoreductase [Candidatus Hydrogenedentes bacterium]|nr:Gfo/Idh/MocA family oxidoreductase [Candidatus Hydrogenedentota bacterium]
MTIRAAILGYGRSGSSLHARPLDELDDFQVAAVCDVDPERQKQARERFGCVVYDDYHEMLKRESLDVVSVVTWSDQHCRMTCDCLAAGVNVVVTKPWAVNVREAERMAAAAADSGMLLMPWLPARWGCDLLRLRQLMDANAIGNVFLVRRAHCAFATRCDWQTQRVHGGGYLLNWGPHLIEPPYLLMGSRVTSVYARMKQTINPGDVEDMFLAVMTLENGVVIQSEFAIAAEDLPSWFIQGDEGAIVMHGPHLKLNHTTPKRPTDPTQPLFMKSEDTTITEETIDGNLYGDEYAVYKAIAKALRGEEAFPVKPEDALELSRVIDAIRTSAEENRVVHLPTSPAVT